MLIHYTNSMTYFNIRRNSRSRRFVTRVTRRVPLMEQEVLILPEHLRSPPVLSWARVTRCIVYCVLICRSLFVLLRFFAHCGRCSGRISTSCSISGTRRVTLVTNRMISYLLLLRFRTLNSSLILCWLMGRLSDWISFHICISLFVLLCLFAHCVDWPSLIYGFTILVVFKLFVSVVGNVQKLDISLTMIVCCVFVCA
jgi:hypothetical protein